MTLEGAISINETENYSVYTMNSVNTGQYGIVVPKNIVSTLNMLVDLHMKSSFDEVSKGIKTKDQLVTLVTEEYNKLCVKYPNSMLVIPMVDEELYKSAVLNNDKQKMFDEVKKIGAITSELYKKLTDSGVEKQKIDQKIIIVEKNEEDGKFVVWLKEQMPNFVDGIIYKELEVKEEVSNPFMAGNDIFGPAPVAATPVVEQPVNTSPSVEETPAPVISSNDIFGTSVSQNVEQPVVASTESSTPVVEQPVNPVPTVEPTNTTSAVEEPKPVSGAALEGTIAFTPIPEHPNKPVEPEEDNTSNTSVAEHASKGFANLIILLIILVGVTIASIELGKFLYSVYGA